MRRRLLTSFVLGSLACGRGPAAAPPSIPPAAASAPLALPEPDASPEAASAEPAAPTACHAPPKSGVEDPDFTLVRRYIERGLIARTGIPSVAVAVARDGEILWEQGFGVADRRRRIRADEHTMYSLASVSKPFTATAIMVLRRQGKLRLDQPLSELLPPPGVRAGAGHPDAVTVRRVASHTAGLPTHAQFYFESEGDPPAPAITRERYAVTVNAPGARYVYSNLGYGLLEHVIAHVSGTDYARFMRAEVFEPLGLRHTFVGPPPRAAGAAAVRYDLGGRPIPSYGFDHAGASALYSSAHDLVRFGMAHLGQLDADQRELLSADARALMQQPVPPAPYGLGFGVGRDGAVARVSHTGGMPGVGTMLFMMPEQGVVIVVLANARIGSASRPVVGLIQDALGIPSRSDDLCRLPPGHPLPGAWTGRVETPRGPLPFALELRASGEVLATLGDDPPRLVRGVQLSADQLTGWLWGNVAAERAGGWPTLLRLELGLELGLAGPLLQGGVHSTVVGTSYVTMFARLERDAAP